MLNSIGKLAVRLAELGEAEGRMAREHLDRLLQRIILLLGAALVALAGLAFLIVGVYGLLAEAVGVYPAAMMIGVGLILLGGVLYAVSSVFTGSLPNKK